MTAEPTQPAADIVERLRAAPLWNGSTLHTEAADEIERLRAAAAVQVPVAWIRVHPDGTYSDDLLPNWQIERVRRESGAWIPLSLAASAPPPPEGAQPALGWITERLGAYGASFNGVPRTEWQDGWNACVDEVIRLYEEMPESPPPEGAPVAQALRELVALYDQRLPLRERPEVWEAARAALSHQPVGSVTPDDGSQGAPSGPGSTPSEEPSGT